MSGLIQLYTGDGKGKTTAAMGLAVRAAGNDLKVLITQFLKDGSSGEIRILSGIPGISCFPCREKLGFIRYMDEAQKKRAKDIYRDYFDMIIKKAAEEKYDLLVLDELMAAWNAGMADHDDVLRFLRTKPDKLEVVMTGRNAPEEIVMLCDYVTECKKIRHPYDRGIAARKGIEL